MIINNYLVVVISYNRRKVLEACRGFKHLFNEARERASKALGFTKKLRNDLENAAMFSIDVSMAELMTRLEASGHVQVRNAALSKCIVSLVRSGVLS